MRTWMGARAIRRGFSPATMRRAGGRMMLRFAIAITTPALRLSAHRAYFCRDIHASATLYGHAKLFPMQLIVIGRSRVPLLSARFAVLFHYRRLSLHFTLLISDAPRRYRHHRPHFRSPLGNGMTGSSAIMPTSKFPLHFIALAIDFAFIARNQISHRGRVRLLHRIDSSHDAYGDSGSLKTSWMQSPPITSYAIARNVKLVIPPFCIRAAAVEGLQLCAATLFQEPGQMLP